MFNRRSTWFDKFQKIMEVEATVKRFVRLGFLLSIVLIVAACGSSYVTGITWGDQDPSTLGGSHKGEGGFLVYEDRYIRAEFAPALNTAVHFKLHNRSNQTIRIIWDDAVFVNVDGSTSRVMHAGVRYIDRNNSQPPTTIPAGGNVSELVLPTNNVYFVSGSGGGWRTSPIVPRTSDPTIYDGRMVSVFLPVEVGKDRHEYRFNFRLMIRER